MMEWAPTNGWRLSPAKSAGRKKRAAATITFKMYYKNQVHLLRFQFCTRPMRAMLNHLPAVVCFITKAGAHYVSLSDRLERNGEKLFRVMAMVSFSSRDFRCAFRFFELGVPDSESFVNSRGWIVLDLLCPPEYIALWCRCL